MSDIDPAELRARLRQLADNRLRAEAGQPDSPACDALSIACHPDLSELNVQLDAFYD
jgi:hypothetical protein